MELIKESKIYNKNLSTISVPIYTETDVIVPDVKPDIAKIIHSNVRTSIESANVNGNKVTFELLAEASVIYLGDDDKVRSVQTSHNFRQTVEAKENLDEAKFSSNIKGQHLECILINSRKLGLRLSAQLEVNFYAKEVIEYVTDIVEEGTQKKRKTMSTCFNNFLGADGLVTKNILEVPVGKPSVSEILDIEATAEPGEAKAAGNKVLVKGDLSVRALYLGDDETINILENVFPISEIVSIDSDIENESDVFSKLSVDRLHCLVSTDSDGENRVISVDAYLKAYFTQKVTFDFERLDDVFSVKKDIAVTRMVTSLPKTRVEKEDVITISDVLNPDCPITNVADLKISTTVMSDEVLDGKLSLRGEANVSALYLNTADNSMGSAYKAIPFEKMIYVGECEAPDVRLEAVKPIYNINIAGEIEFSFNIKVDITEVGEAEFDYLTDIDYAECEEERDNRPYALRIYYAKDGDSIWSIAKKYRVSVGTLVCENGESLAAGQKIIIQG